MQLIAFALRVVPLICHPESRVSGSLKGAKVGGGGGKQQSLGSHHVHKPRLWFSDSLSMPTKMPVWHTWPLGQQSWLLILINRIECQSRAWPSIHLPSTWLNFVTIRWPGCLTLKYFSSREKPSGQLKCNASRADEKKHKCKIKRKNVKQTRQGVRAQLEAVTLVIFVSFYKMFFSKKGFQNQMT